MRKLSLILSLALLITCRAMAVTVSLSSAQTVALNFYKSTAHGAATNKSLRAVLNYTSSSNGTVYFYVFNITPATGFVIVSADDVVEPIIGYSLESNFNANAPTIGITNWMKTTSGKISAIITQHLPASGEISGKWNVYTQGIQPVSAQASSVGPLLTTTWNQEPYYNMYCPYNSTDSERCVTGCVACAMSQIMKYWNYPTTGTGSYSYCDCTPSYSYGYGTLSANFGATTYNWAAMPNSINANNTSIGTLMYQAGVSVAMGYGDDNEGGSGAYVFQSQSGGSNNPCAQQAYSLYFGYNSATMQGLTQSNYTNAAWITLIQNELNAGRPVEYEGWDPNAGGHTWVCDGYESDTLFHMNWGWGGYDNGYFSLSNLNPNPYAFTSNDGALIGIEPLTSACSVPTGMSTASITTSSATFNWTAVSGASSYKIQYEAVGASTWTTGTSSTNSFSCSGLAASTNYVWQVETVCSGGNSAFTSSTSFTTLTPPCNTPTGLSTSSITTSSATFNWTAVSGATSYDIRYEVVGASTWSTGTSSTNSFNVSGLAASTNYVWQVETVCSGGSSAFTSSTSFTTLTPPCNTPTGLSTSSITTSSAAFDWTAVSGATSYDIRYEIVGASTWSTGTSSTNSFNVSGLATSTNYVWQVETVCSGGSSAFTSSTSFTTLTPPCNIPTGLSTSSITTSSAAFDWTAVSGALSYSIRYEESGASTWSTGTSSTNSFNVSGLAASTNYVWQVETVCSGGSSAFTSSTSFTTLTPPCNTPTGISTSSITTSSATFNWTAVSGATSYNIQYEEVGASTWSTGTSSTNSFNVSGLAASTNYVWQVETVCSGGTSAFTSSTSFTTLTPPCNIPTGLSTSSITTSSATFNWTPVSGAVSYSIRYEESGASTWSTGTSSTNSFSVSGLAASTNYVWQVETVCSGGSSAFTSSTSFTTLTPPCNIPTGISTSSITTSSATFNWTAVSGALSYSIRYEESGASTWSTGTSSTNSFNVSGLAASTNYVWQVETICSGDNSTFSSSTSFTTLTTACNTPTGLSTESIATSSATFSWTAVSGADSYNIQYEEVGASTWTTGTSSTNSFNVSGLAASTAYSWEVETVCSAGSSGFSSFTGFTTLTPSCNTPTGLNTTSIATSSATFNWTAVSGASSYHIQYKESGASTWTTGTSSTNSFNVSGLVASANYIWQVQTICSGGSSGFTSSTSFTTLTPPCNTPTGLATSNITTSSATFSWTAVSGASSYNIQYQESGASTWTTGASLSNSFSASGLASSTTYKWEVQTVCSGGSSAFTSSTSFTTLTPPCNTPTGLATSNITTSSATFSWTAVSGAVSYSIRYEESGASTWTTGTSSTNSFNVSGLAASTNYLWQVQTVCSGGSSASTSSVDFATTTPACGVPVALSATGISTTGATLTWGSVAGVVSYTLQWKTTSGTLWTTVAGLTTNSYALSGLAPCGVYEFEVLTVCGSGTSAYSSASDFNTGCTNNYCTSEGIDNTYEYIDNVTLGTINNTSINTDIGYANFTSLSTNLEGGSTYTITLTPGFHSSPYDEFWVVWIDYNQNGEFTDAGEKVAEGNSSGSVNLSFTVPTSALNGATRMRIQMQYGAYTGNPCLVYSYGEVEDYTINITGNIGSTYEGVINPVAPAESINNEVKLYPNPAKDYITMDYSSQQHGDAIVNIYDVIGNKVITQAFDAAEGLNTLNINTTMLGTGIYIFEIENNGVVQRQKFTVVR